MRLLRRCAKALHHSIASRTRWQLLALGTRLLILLLIPWSVLVEPRWVAHREIPVTVTDWQGPPGLKVAVASDWHFTKNALRRVMTVERARKIVAEINAAKPDVILLPGDFIAEPDYQPEIAATPEDEIAAVLGELRAPLGVYSAMGNHDYWHSGPRFRAAFARRGITDLENDVLQLKGTTIWVAGVGDSYSNHADPAGTVARLPKGAQSLVLMHEPGSFLKLPPVTGLVVAGHTHGGQVSLPFFGAPIVPSDGPREWAYGWVRHEANTMYITSGLGVSIFPIRFNMRPEWVMFTISAGKPS
ncbi:MAG: hypothetical protein JWQ72_2690 [Polaromonas sp.]|nr:hypothetical protein [Polaromonas sp.]